MSVVETILAEENLKCNSFLIFTLGDRLNDVDLEFDRVSLEKYIYRESSPHKINMFEKRLWDSKFYVGYNTSDLIRDLIRHYFYNDDDCRDNILRLISKDFKNLKKRYINYKFFLFYKYEILTERKFLLNLKLFMENQMRYNDNKNLIISLIKLWCMINIDTETLRKKFIPLAFSIWYKDYEFYTDYFCHIASDDTKNEFYKVFLESIKFEDCTMVNSNIEKVLKKLKLFYFLSN